MDRAYLRPLQEPLYDAEYAVNGVTRLTYFQRPISQVTAHNNRTKDFDLTNLNQSSMLDYPREFSLLGFSIMVQEDATEAERAAIYSNSYFQFTLSGRRPYLTLPLIRMPRHDNRTAFNLFLAATREFNHRNDPPPPEATATGVPDSEVAQQALAESDNRELDLSEEVAELIQMAREERYPQPIPNLPPDPLHLPGNGPRIEEPESIEAPPPMQPMSDREYQAWKDAFKKIQVERVPYYRFNIGRGALKITPGRAFNAQINWTRGLEISRPILIHVFLEGLQYSPL